MSGGRSCAASGVASPLRPPFATLAWLNPVITQLPAKPTGVCVFNFVAFEVIWVRQGVFDRHKPPLGLALSEARLIPAAIHRACASPQADPGSLPISYTG